MRSKVAGRGNVLWKDCEGKGRAKMLRGRHREHRWALRALLSVFIFAFLFAAIPVSAHQAESNRQFTLQIYGNANEDDTIDMRDVTYIKLVIFGKKPETALCDANYDGRVSMLDVVQTKLIIVGKEGKLTLKDFLDRTVTVEEPVRAAVLNSNFELMIYALGAYNQVAAVSEKYREKYPLIKALIEAGKIPEDLPKIGGSLWSGLDLEKLMEVSPDCVILWAYSEADYERVEEIEEKAGIPVIAIDLDVIEDLDRAMLLLGWLFNKELEAEEIIDRMREEREKVLLRTDEVEEKVTTFLVYYLKDSEISTEGKGGVNIDILERINTIPVTGDIEQKYLYVSLEQVYAWDPDVIILFSMSKETLSPDMIYNNSAWAGLKAVKNGRVCDLTGYYYSKAYGWHPGGISMRMLALAKCAYPDLFEDIEEDEYARNLFYEYYGISFIPSDCK